MGMPDMGKRGGPSPHSTIMKEVRDASRMKPRSMRPSNSDMRIAAEWLRNDAECADVEPEREHEVEAITRVHNWLWSQGDKPEKKSN